MTEWQVRQYARKHRFTITTAVVAGTYRLRSVGSKHDVFVGPLRECFVWLLGYTWNHGA